MNDKAIAAIKHHFWRCNVNLTDEQAADIIEIDVNLSAIGAPGFTPAFTNTLGSLSMSDIERLFPVPSKLKTLRRKFVMRLINLWYRLSGFKASHTLKWWLGSDKFRRE